MFAVSDTPEETAAKSFSESETPQRRAARDPDDEAEAYMDRVIAAEEGGGISGKRVGAIGDLFLLVFSQSASSIISDIITTLGLDGRIDVLILILAFSIVTLAIYMMAQTSISERNKRDKIILIASALHRAGRMKKRNPIKSLTTVSRRQLELSSKYMELANLSTNYILYRHQFSWRRFIATFLEFITMVSGLVMTYYIQRCFTLFLTNANISIYTMCLPMLNLFIFFVALKSEFLPYSSDGEIEK